MDLSHCDANTNSAGITMIVAFLLSDLIVRPRKRKYMVSVAVTLGPESPGIFMMCTHDERTLLIQFLERRV